MSLEAAKKLLTEVNRDTFAGKSEEEIIAYLKKLGCDCTLDEVKKAYILAEPLSEDEMEKVAGGKQISKNTECFRSEKENNATLLGGDRAKCTGDYYNESCSDTVEAGSNCWSGDLGCAFSGRTYTRHCASTQKEPEPFNPGRSIIH